MTMKPFDLRTAARRLVRALPEARITSVEGQFSYGIVLRFIDGRILVLERGRDAAHWVQLRHVARIEPLAEVPS